MRNRRKTIESLRRLAERPGTTHEGENEKRALARMLERNPKVRPFNACDFPKGTLVFYNYWAYTKNDPCVVVGKQPKTIQSQTWMRLKFQSLKQPRWVPVTSVKGSHISTKPLSAEEANYLHTPYES
jgi:hypothetical protein